MPEVGRRQLHGWLSKDAINGWHGFAEEHAVNVTALMEAVGLWLGDLHPDPNGRPKREVAAIVNGARAVASRRSSRVRRDDAGDDV